MENAEERAYRYIISEILTGAYRPGDFLLELDIAPKLQMSRTPVSRALSRLVLEGFLNKMPKKGCYIPIPTPKDAEHVFTARMVAEGEAAGIWWVRRGAAGMGVPLGRRRVIFSFRG